LSVTELVIGPVVPENVKTADPVIFVPLRAPVKLTCGKVPPLNERFEAVPDTGSVSSKGPLPAIQLPPVTEFDQLPVTCAVP
jgi:hypothetical protein